MHKRFLEYIKAEGLFTLEDRILVAVSGGMDSMTLAEMMRINRFVFSIAHFNHMTRNGESDLDEEFVREYAKKHDIPFYSTRMDIQAMLQNENGGNFQNLARLHRYRWLEQVRTSLAFDYIATAHHHNDQIETFLFHFSRGTGLDGLTGISAKQFNIVRPMLVFTRGEIEDYVFQNRVNYRMDSSNFSSKYSRNYIRHGIIPSFKILNPQFENNANKTIENLRSARSLYNYFVRKAADEHLKEKPGGTFHLDQSVFKDQPEAVRHQLCFELIRPFGFNYSQVCQILDAAPKRGATFYTDSHVLLVEKSVFIIRETRPVRRINQEINADCAVQGFGILRFEKVDSNPVSAVNPNIEYIDADKIQFPLILRNKEDGDRFKPIGMKGRSKKIKDFFTDIKLNKFDKDRALVLLSNGKVIWIPGYRLSEIVKITSRTRNILKMVWEPAVE
jgi:tRNA(Ile)-lysidine synthase